MTSPDALAAKQPNALGALLRIPVFRRLWAGITLSSLGDWLGLLATTALAAYLTRDQSGVLQGAAVSGVLVTRLLPDLILSPVAGALVDRFDRRKVAVICDLTAGVVYLVIAFSQSLPLLLVGQFVVEAVGLFSTPAKQAMWVNIIPRERLAVANQLNYVSIYGMVPVASVVFALLNTFAQFFQSVPDTIEGGSIAGGIAGSQTSHTAVVIALIFNAGTFLVSASVVYFSRRLIPSFVGERTATRSVFSLVREGISFVKNNRFMRALYVGILGAFGAGGLVAGVAQAYVATLGAGSAGYGILFGSVFTGLALGMLAGPKVLPNVPRRAVFTAGIALSAVMLLLLSVIPDFLGAVVTASFMGFGAGVAWITGFTMIGHEVSDQLRGRVFAFVMSSVRLILLGAIAVGPVLAGAIGGHRMQIGTFSFDFSGPGIVLAIGGLLALVVSIIAAKQVGGPVRGGGIVRRMLARRRLLAEHQDRAGVLIAVEGRDPVATESMASAIADRLAGEGWKAVRERGIRLPSADDTSLAAALRAAATLSDKLTDRLEPALTAGSVVVVQDYLDAYVVRYGAAAGLDEEKLHRLGVWVSQAARPDLTILVDAPDVAPQPLDDEDLLPEIAEAATESGPGAEFAPATTSNAHGTVGSADGIDITHAYRERLQADPERYLLVAPLGTVVDSADSNVAADETGVGEAAGVDLTEADSTELRKLDDGLSVELVARIASVLRLRSPASREIVSPG